MATSKELMASAMAQKKPSSIPVMCQLANGHTVINTKVHPIDYFLSNDVWADCLIQMRAKYDFDGILVHKPGRVKGIEDMIERRDYDMETPTLYLKDGSRIECTRDDDSYYKPAEGFKRPTLDELNFDAPLDWAPETFKAFQASKATYDYNKPEDIPDHVFGTIDRVIAKVGNEYSVHGEVRAPFDHFLNILGMEDGLVALMDNPERCHKLMERLTPWSISLAVAQVRRGAQAIKVSSPFAGSGFLSREMYEEFVLPFESQLAQAVRAEGGAIYTHTCGAIGDRLDLLCRCGVSGIECLDPEPLGNVDIKDAVTELKGKIFIKGNIDPVNTLLRGSADTIRRDVTYTLESAGHDMPGFILSSACSVAPPAPPDNLKLMVDLCRQFKV
jgi:uroporphyrinogen-III decarboxylase